MTGSTTKKKQDQTMLKPGDTCPTCHQRIRAHRVARVRLFVRRRVTSVVHSLDTRSQRRQKRLEEKTEVPVMTAVPVSS